MKFPGYINVDWKQIPSIIWTTAFILIYMQVLIFIHTKFHHVGIYLVSEIVF